ncbi:hypothetical protein LWI28_008093 [Acer negundo]|uniref:Uncharacterized protein n=1 Tax=Acer negundo TaxID=4023 RepID=A0AAD5NIX5_ACENE|nr:hypothetical protein LWI28_008093 [Acer negundo]
MAVAFYDVNSATGLEKLDEYLITYSYITGYQASKDDLTVYIALSKSTSSDYVNTFRWYNHIDAPGDIEMVKARINLSRDLDGIATTMVRKGMIRVYVENGKGNKMRLHPNLELFSMCKVGNFGIVKLSDASDSKIEGNEDIDIEIVIECKVKL